MTNRLLINPPHSNLAEIRLEHTCIQGGSKIWEHLEPISEALDRSTFQVRKDWEFLRDFDKCNPKDLSISFAKISKTLLIPTNDLIFEEFFKFFRKTRGVSLERLLIATNDSPQTGEEILAFIFNIVGNIPPNNREGKDRYLNFLERLLKIIESNPDSLLANCDKVIAEKARVKVKFFTLDKFRDRLKE